MRVGGMTLYFLFLLKENAVEKTGARSTAAPHMSSPSRACVSPSTVGGHGAHGGMLVFFPIRHAREFGVEGNDATRGNCEFFTHIGMRVTSKCGRLPPWTATSNLNMFTNWYVDQ